MTRSADIISAVVNAPTWDERVAVVRRIATSFSSNEQPDVYADVAKAFYVPQLTYTYAYVGWPEGYELTVFDQAYATAHALTRGFVDVAEHHLVAVLSEAPETLRVFRTILGYTRPELAQATEDADLGSVAGGVSVGVIGGMEAGKRGPTLSRAASACARAIDATMTGTLHAPAPDGQRRSKQQKPDTVDGWDSVRRFAAHGVPYSVHLHQRLYGGAFRTIQDSSSAQFGEDLETPVAAALTAAGISFVRSGSSGADKAIVSRLFDITLNLVPDFVVHRAGALRAFIEAKNINDGGTARDKAARFRAYRAEGQRLGGIPVFAVLDGAGWRRTKDALGPVVEACDGRVFTAANIGEMLTVEPFPQLTQSA